MKNNVSLKYETELWKSGIGVIAGVDEVGRGCLAGPVYAALVSFKKLKNIPESLSEVNDSKKLSAKKRKELSIEIKKEADFFTIKSASVAEINTLGIVGALDLAIERCIKEAKKEIEVLLIDGYGNEASRILNLINLATFYQGKRNPLEALKFVRAKGDKKNPIGCLGIIGGDALCFSIASASIIAKVERDSFMESIAEKFPEYKFEKHRGYGTKEHFGAIEKYGICELHRIGYKPIKNHLNQ